MKKLIKKKNIDEILIGSELLANCIMNGDLAHAIVKSRFELKRLSEEYHNEFKNLSVKYWAINKQGKPVTEFQKDAQGNDLKDLPMKIIFKDAESETAAMIALQELGEREIEMVVKKFHINVIEELKNISPAQIEAISWLVELE